MRAILDAVLKRFITIGRLTVRWPDGRLQSYAGRPGPEGSLAIHTNGAIRRLMLNPALAVGECYMDGTLTPDARGVYDVLDVLVTNFAANSRELPMAQVWQTLRQLKRKIDQHNPAGRAQRNVAHHYDLNGRLYSLFLDRDRQYSCAYFPRGDETLEEAQAAKKRHIAAKLLLTRPNLTVLDIGCGWGGMALTLARDYGARVTGITLSTEQLAEARNRAAAEGLSDRVTFELVDYRAMAQRFDRIVSVGMFEHVGIGYYPAFFETVSRCLNPDGVALLHAIGRSDPPSATNPWIAKYIFPGGYCPALSEVLPPIERSGLVATDIEVLRLHYAETLRHWRRRFTANRDAIASLYDERFCRMWEFYLCGAELSFRREGNMVFQIQLAHDQTAVPLTRDYITASERQMQREKA
ncbi:MAG TPA: cyclopropane-fatty-acyl-phospholipid synthase family protein [Acetobacteraceae bacterium]|jgi:cyclopropane-fatty-acyl-phospholipid synthase|nr:cyclopropane-fatty-acyl-phospholipid synthase family protein [Acetobacteraceae bacterium]